MNVSFGFWGSGGARARYWDPLRCMTRVLVMFALMGCGNVFFYSHVSFAWQVVHEYFWWSLVQGLEFRGLQHAVLLDI